MCVCKWKPKEKGDWTLRELPYTFHKPSWQVCQEHAVRIPYIKIDMFIHMLGTKDFKFKGKCIQNYMERKDKTIHLLNCSCFWGSFQQFIKQAFLLWNLLHSQENYKVNFSEQVLNFMMENPTISKVAGYRRKNLLNIQWQLS